MYVLEDFISQYNNLLRTRKTGGGDDKSSLELEVRFKNTTYEDFIKIVSLLISDGYSVEVVKSIVSIVRVNDEDVESVLREIVFKDGREESFRRKVNLLTPMKDTSKILPYKVSCCSEENISTYDMSSCSMIRVKIRLSFTKPDEPWRYDLTIVRNISPESADYLKTVVRSMFKKKIDTSNLVVCLHDFLDDYYRNYDFEIEAERLKDGPLTPVDVTDVVYKVVGGINSEYLQESLFREQIITIANAIGYHREIRRYTLKEILPQVVSLSRKDYQEIFPPKGWTITDKLDGIRAAIVCSGGPIYIVSDKLITLPERSSISFVAEGELVDDTLYLFDVMMFDNKLVYEYEYSDRITFIDNIIRVCGTSQVTTKKFVQIEDDLKMAFDTLLKSPHVGDKRLETDGIILVEPNAQYSETVSYKWKPLDQTTIDFLVKKYTFPHKSSKPGYDLYYLFVGINTNIFKTSLMQYCRNYSKMFEGLGNREYFPIQFSPSSCPTAYMYWAPHGHPLGDLNNKVVEFKLANTDEPCGTDGVPSWEPVRIREDRTRDYESMTYFGNDFRIAELTWNNFLDPLHLEDLSTGVVSYFQEEKSSVYKPQVHFLSFVKSTRIQSFTEKDWIVDLASGKGQDLNRYFQSGIKHLVCVDQDKTALAELVKRKYDIIQSIIKKRKQKGKITFHAHTGTQVIVIPANIDDKKTVLKMITQHTPKEGVDVVVCNLALHYFMKTRESLVRFITLCRDILRKGGKVVFMVLNGEKIFEQLDGVSYGNSYDIFQDGSLKNSIRKLYSEDTIQPVGQEIEVLLPFSRGTYYKEYLVNVSYITKELEAKGFEVSPVAPVLDHLTAFEAQNPRGFEALREEDKEYLDIFCELVAVKK